MLRAAYLHRRRLGIGVAGVAAYMAIWQIPQATMGAQGLVQVTLGALLLSLGFVLPVFVALQRLRELFLIVIDIVVLAFLPFALMRMLGPAHDLLSHGDLEAVLLLGASFTLSYWALAGNMLDRFTMKPSRVANVTFKSEVSAQRAWRALVPRPAHEGGYAFAGTKFVVDQDAPVFDCRTPREMTVCFTNQDWAIYSVFQIEVTEVVEGRYFRATFKPLDASGALKDIAGWFALTFAPQPDGSCALQIELQVLSCPLRWRINWFLGDAHQAFARILGNNILTQINLVDDAHDGSTPAHATAA